MWLDSCSFGCFHIHLIIFQHPRQLSEWYFTIRGNHRQTPCPGYIYHASLYDKSLFSYVYSGTISQLAMEWMGTGDIDIVSPKIHILPLALSSILVNLNTPLFEQSVQIALNVKLKRKLKKFPKAKKISEFFLPTSTLRFLWLITLYFQVIRSQKIQLGLPRPFYIWRLLSKFLKN